MITSVFERNSTLKVARCRRSSITLNVAGCRIEATFNVIELDVVVAIACWHIRALVVFLQEDEDVPSVYNNLKIFLWNGPLYAWWVLYTHPLHSSEKVNILNN